MVAPDGREFQKHILIGRDGRHGERILIGKKTQFRLPVVAFQPFQNMFHSYHVLICAAQISAMRAAADAVRAVVAPNIIVMRPLPEQNCELIGGSFDKFQRLPAAGAEIPIPRSLAILVHSEPFGMYFKHRARQKPIDGMQFVFDRDAVFLERRDRALRFLAQKPVEVPVHAAVPVQRMKSYFVDAALLKNREPFHRKVLIEQYNSSIVHFNPSIRRRISLCRRSRVFSRSLFRETRRTS